MKKRILATVLAAFALLSAAGCGGTSKNSNSKKDTEGSVPVQKEEADSADPAPEEDVKTGGTMTGSGDLGDYHVEIKDAEIITDYEGNPAVVVTYA